MRFQCPASPEKPHAESPLRCVATLFLGCRIAGMDDQVDDPHDDAFLDAPEDPEFTNERCWIEAGSAGRGPPMVFAERAGSVVQGTPRFSIDWADAHREATYPADPTYPFGCSIDVALDAPRACRAQLPSAVRIGTWVVRCTLCGYVIALASAGRRDDPRSVRVPCRAR